ncbi:hypothetical protein PybrP1_005350 [[Pythium] brassicae (nom. inval.)]|nr:hypothetical protein PybrP1_005350 [[Pythium] brassicae (nom. inval.)]
MQSVQLVEELSKLHDLGASHVALRIRDAALEVLVALSLHPSAVRDSRRRDLTERCVGSLLEKWDSNSGDREQVQQSFLRILSVPRAADIFFASTAVQSVVQDATSQLLSSSSFTLALNSSPDECPCEVRQQMNDLTFLRCCLSTQHAADALLSPDMRAYDTNLILQFIVNTLADHGDSCLSTCDREDLCTLAWELALALVSSIPALLACADLFVTNRIAVLVGKDARSIRQEDWSVSPCTLLQMQLQHAFEVVGGPSEKIQRCELHDFDPISSGWGPAISKGEHRSGNAAARGGVAPFVQVLSEKMLASIQSSCERAVPLDFVMLSQASWELILEIEGRASLSSLELTEVVGRLLYALVMSKRSRVDEPTSAAVRAAPVALPLSSFEATLPSDAQRRLLNQLYKGYCGRLGLKTSPTTLHCIAKTFGRCTIDTFPVTALMVLDQLVSEKKVLAFLVHCWSSPGCAFLWPSTATELVGGDDCSPLQRVASAVEFVLEHEDPQCIDQCHCSVLALVLRWLSQCFWNYFDWNNIVLYLYLTALYGVESQVYVVVAVVKHLTTPLKELSSKYNNESAAPFMNLIERPIAGFCFGQWRTLFLRLRNEYHNEVAQMLRSAPEPTEAQRPR